jgi:hypothetical protein
VWAAICEPYFHGDDLDDHTPLYAEAYLALEKLGMCYSVYVATVSKRERLLNQFVFALAGAKEKRAIERSHEQAEMERHAQQILVPPGRP